MYVKALLALALVGSTAAMVRSAGPTRKPNILIIVADDYGYADCGVQGCRDIPTPNIDSIAKNGIRCTNGYVSGPYCSPTRAGLLTGRYQQRFGHEFNPGPGRVNDDDAIGLALTETTLPQRLKAAGYATGMVGKWHLGNSREHHPLSRGFDEFYGFLGGAHPYFNFATPQNPVMRGREPLTEPAGTYLTEAFGREATAFLDRRGAQPFFLYLAFNSVHTPMQAPEKYLERFPNLQGKRRTYAAMTAAMDDAIGGVLESLRKKNLEDDTLIFFISDNGGPETANASDNGPLRGQKAQTWEGGVHVPWFAQWKGKIPAGKTFDSPVIQLDILPTAMAAAGVKADNDWKLDGVDLLPYFRDGKKGTPHSTLYWRFGPQMAIRSGDWKLVKAPDGGPPRGGRQGAATVEGAQLYNLKDDLGEQTNVAAQQPEKVRQLSAAWEKWNAELAEPAFRPRRMMRRRQPMR
jgi:arylsulfatase A-like enzyme